MLNLRALKTHSLAILSLSAVAATTIVAGSFLWPDQSEAQRREVPSSREAVRYSYAPIVRKAAPAVVNVYVRRRVRTFSSPFANDPFFRQFFGNRFGRPSERVQSSLGSGVIVSPDGIVVTNTHVIKGMGKTEIRVALSDKREFDAKVISQDSKTDIAILKILNDDEVFPTLELEDSDTLEVGDLVLAIGNPFGVGQTVTSGIVSAVSRSQVGRNDAQVFIQTDAAINPGNSGGALVDMAGKLVGINTLIFSRSGGSNGIGFAIPSNLVRLYVDSAREGKTVQRPWIGARLENVTRDVADALGLTRISGALVSRISDAGPAERAGLTPGDVITHVDDFEVNDARSARYRMTTRGIGKSVRLTLLREGRPKTVRLKLTAAPKPKRGDIRNLVGDHPFDGARMANLLPSLTDEYDIDAEDGVLVLSVRRNSIAARLGLRAGDVVTRIGRRDIRDLRDLERAVARRERLWRLQLKRRGKTIRLRVPG